MSPVVVTFTNYHSRNWYHSDIDQLIRRLEMRIDALFDNETGPGIEERVLLNYLITRGEEFLWDSPPGPRSFWWTLVEILVSQDERFREELSTIRVTAYRSALLEVLRLLKELQKEGPIEMVPVSQNVSEDRSLLDERDCRTILRYVWKEGRRQLDSENSEFLQVWFFLGWIGLQVYPRRLKEFEELLKSDLPEKELLQKGHDLIREALFGGDSNGTHDPDIQRIVQRSFYMSILERRRVTAEEAQRVISFALMMAESLLEDDADHFQDLDRILKLSSTALETVPSCSTMISGPCRSAILTPREMLEKCVDQLREGYAKVIEPEYARLDDPSVEYLVLLRLVEDND